MHQFLTVIDQTDANFDLTTVEEVNAQLGLTSDTANDATVAAQITSSSKIIAELCGRVFALQTVRETFRIKGRDSWGDVINLSRYPVNEITSLTIGGVEADASGYEIDYNAGVVYRVHGTWPRASVIVVEYSGGYNLPDEAPAGLANAAIAMIQQQRAAQSVNGSNLGIRDIWSGENRVSYFDSSSIARSSDTIIEGLIAPYRRFAV